jgi:hypothetical protein
MKVAILVTCFFALLSCGSRDESEVAKKEIRSQKLDPESNLSSPYTDSVTALYCKWLGLDYFKNDSTSGSHIRVWIEYAKSDSGKILDIKNVGKGWVAELHNYRFQGTQNGRMLKTHDVFKGQPRSGWNQFLLQIRELGIYDLYVGSSQRSCNDADVMSVEIFSDNRYSEFVYRCWTILEDQVPIKKVEKVLLEVEKEFGFVLFPITNVGSKPKDAGSHKLIISETSIEDVK